MVETPNDEAIIIYPQLDNGMQFRFDKINQIKDYFIADF